MKTFDGFLHVSMRSPGVEAEDERKVVYTVSIKHVLSCQPRVTVTSCFVDKVIRDL